ncbi:phytoene desaturase family protein [Embleya scabrispora]|uniref:phytoene desaturase family protein n=1 Tax=Embleya scabrispora TaxID=159449 RepID=UPI000363B574|nr:NAD(P)/FAD-dependent oxidoreductase [Embleya scabrispora]MYS85115.1 NAD(P)-binding protein [Streptomyces sp. SID5474]
MSDHDVIIVGAGHNGLAAGAVLAKNGLRVLVLERHSRLGGACTTDEVTLPGFKHDLYGSSHVWNHINPGFKEILPELERDFGLRYIWAEDHITGHPMKHGPGIVVHRDVDKTCESIAWYSEKDARRYREIYDNFVNIRDGFVTGMFSPPNPPSLMSAMLETTPEGVEMLRSFTLSPHDFAMENFENEHVRSFILGWATAAGNRPWQEGRGELIYIMIPAIHEFGESIPEGGTIELPNALARMIEHYGGTVLTEAPVKRFLATDGEASGVELEDGRTFHAGKGVVTTLNPKLFGRMFDEGVLDDAFLEKVRHYNPGDFTIVRAHFALHEAPKYLCGEEVDHTPFQRIFGSVDDIRRQYAEIELGIAPTNPFLWVACWTLKDPTRAPEGKHTLIMDTFVPIELANGEDWDEVGEKYMWDVMLPKLQEYTSNMTTENILGSYIQTGPSMERDNPCLVNGTTTGGAMRQSQGGIFRPFAGFSDYRGPLKKLYMAGSYCHPGGAISAAGTVTAGVILEDLGLRASEF